MGPTCIGRHYSLLVQTLAERGIPDQSGATIPRWIVAFSPCSRSLRCWRSRCSGRGRRLTASRRRSDRRGGGPGAGAARPPLASATGDDRRYALAIGCYALQDTTYGYDAFGRMKTSDGPGVTDQGTVSYDGLDRRDAKAEAGEALDYAYVGLSEKLSREQTATAKVRQYEYDSALRRLGQRTSQSGVGLGYRSFAYDANGSVEGLEGTDGEVLATDRYRYDPYGELQDAETGLSPAARGNPFRFEGFYYDAAVKTYDMQARPYRPDIGRFLVQDRFESASGDFALQSDPMMSNRYTFASANPVNNIEFDGHYAPTGDQSSRNIQTVGGDVQDRQTGRTVSGPNKSSRSTDRSGYVDRRFTQPAIYARAERRVEAATLAAASLAYDIARRHCVGGELCSQQQQARNTAEIHDALLHGEKLSELDLERESTEVPWWDPFNLLVGGGSSAVAKAGVAAGRKLATSLVGSWRSGAGGLSARLADEAGHFAPFAGRSTGGGLKLTSRIKQDASLVREAQRAGRSVQAELDRLQAQLAHGNLNPGIGNRGLFSGVIEARSRGGARLYFRYTSEGVDILAKSDKANQARVIQRLHQLYGEG